MSMQWCNKSVASIFITVVWQTTYQCSGVTVQWQAYHVTVVNARHVSTLVLPSSGKHTISQECMLDCMSVQLLRRAVANMLAYCTAVRQTACQCSGEEFSGKHTSLLHCCLLCLSLQWCSMQESMPTAVLQAGTNKHVSLLQCCVLHFSLASLQPCSAQLPLSNV